MVFVMMALGASLHADDAALVVSGYFERGDQDEEEIALVSGTSEYIRFFLPDQVVRLFVAYPESTDLSAETIRSVFSRIHAIAAKSAFIKSDFGVLNERATAHVETVRLVDGEVLFDCGKPRPCEIQFSQDAMTIVTPSVVSEKRFFYRFIAD